MFENLLNELQTVCISAAGAAITALVIYLFTWLRTFLGIKESDSNEAEIRNAALTEAGKLVVQGKLDDPDALVAAVTKVINDLGPVVQAEEYTTPDIKDMILGAAATFFPPAALIKTIIK